MVLGLHAAPSGSKRETLGGGDCGGTARRVLHTYAPPPISAHSWHSANLPGRAIVVQFFDAPGNSLTPSSPRNSIPCSSKTRRIVLRFRTFIRGVPSTVSLRVIADCETPHRTDSSRTDHFSNARAARSCAPLIGGLDVKFSATRSPSLTSLQKEARERVPASLGVRESMKPPGGSAILSLGGVSV